jgi:hypothetical protein
VNIGNRRVARRLAAVAAYEFPPSVRRRVQLKHSDLRTESTALVETALRQWFRILARRPSSRLSMPSMLVDDMWHEFLLHTRDYAAFCDAAFGRFLHHEPESAMSPDQAAANRSDRLLITLQKARQDERCGPHALPLLFRVDQEVELQGGRRYIVDCGGRECYDASRPDLVCLHHLAGAPLRTRGQGTPWLRGRGIHWPPHGGGGGCGGGCSCGAR